MRQGARRKFVVHTVALALMLGSAGAMYWTAQAGQRGLTIGLLGLFALANALILAPPQGV